MPSGMGLDGTGAAGPVKSGTILPRLPPRSTPKPSSAASDVYKRQN